ncbi:MAG: response regulator [Candidatus Omnitrophota bacterium]
MAKKYRILLVEDDVVFRKYLAKLLVEDGFLATETGTIEAAIDNLEKQKYDLMVADLKLPDDTAIGLLKKLSGKRLDLPVIIITGYGEWETYLEALDLGVSDYLNKPVDYTDLKAKIDAVLLKNQKKR